MASFQKLMMMGTLLCLFLVAKSTPNTSVQYYGCNSNSYSSSDPYANSVAYVLAALMNVTPNHGYDYYTQSPSAEAVAYGHGTCSTALSYNDCADCLTAARALVTSTCGSSVGGTMNMVDCTIRYEKYAF
ncbi:hypothetical protein ACS0TY_013031 [Phlomoides rotata]